ncbi:HEAT repeat domain-containing protein [Marinitenerispora sediminis]|uniref:hypothetical protein n=1 Tax=Marinitenerispora sediminis TaxID=1931232 RepID=UPI0015F17AEE|nr:hypothetical protein [Marinitenerispora sediminis]
MTWCGDNQECPVAAWTPQCTADAPRRDLAVDELGDLLRSAGLAQEAAEGLTSCLVRLAVTDQDDTVRESALNALSEALLQYELPYALVKPLAEHIDGFRPVLVGYVLFVLSSTRAPAARPVIERFLEHPDASLREEAAAAMDELGGR